MNAEIKTTILEGKIAATSWLQEISAKMSTLKNRPRLAIVQLGDNLASNTYIRNKLRVAKELNVTAVHVQLSAETSETALLNLIHTYNQSQAYQGVLIQLPLPKHINEATILEQLDASIDVDGLSFASTAALWMTKNFDPLTQVVPCTPKGIVKLLQFYGCTIAQKNVVIINRSNIVGKPLAAILLALNATVTICHSQTSDLSRHLQQADIIITGVGVVNFISYKDVKPTAVVVDVSINFTADKQMVGDVTPNSLMGVCAAYSPVPKGVGPMTVAAIFDNLYWLAQAKENQTNGENYCHCRPRPQ